MTTDPSVLPAESVKCRRPRHARGIKQPLVIKDQRVRTSRHNQPQTIKVRRVVADKHTGEIKALILHVPVVKPYRTLVAAGPTSTRGKRNTGGVNAGRKSAKKEK
jgi:hypothetical protein